MRSDYAIRPYAPADLPAVHAINEQSTPGVGALSVEALRALIGTPEAACLIAADEAVLGFILMLRPGAAYDSPNYRWFAERLARGEGRPHFYCDRIAIAAAARGRRVGEALYQAAIAAAPATTEVIACEVNSLPPNPGSMRFHARLGFVEVGAATHVAGEKAVVYLERPV
ncbi:MAG: GNAT family N-acetyltransferase [Neomegalonema sp.]|nr:GNAT family N-acetyltransferase [Neomegalonema sp.]